MRIAFRYATIEAFIRSGNILVASVVLRGFCPASANDPGGRCA
jgi:hypothetical protein